MSRRNDTTAWRLALKGFIRDHFLRMLSDEAYLKLFYFVRMHKPLHLKDPQTFNEKLQWLKLHARRPLYTQLADKYEVRQWVAQELGEEYLIPLLGVWERYDEIDFDTLPDQFVLKCSHDSGSGMICRNKATFDFDRAKKQIGGRLEKNYYYNGREWPYKNIRPRVIAEQFMFDQAQPQLIDYKFYCFNGEAKFLYISQGLEDHATARISFYDLDWKPLPMVRTDFKPFDTPVQKPRHADEMVRIVNRLAKKISADFIRIDLYEIHNAIYFSEFTFFPCGGTMPVDPPEADLKLGQMLTLTNQMENDEMS